MIVAECNMPCSKTGHARLTCPFAGQSDIRPMEQGEEDTGSGNGNGAADRSRRGLGRAREGRGRRIFEKYAFASAHPFPGPWPRTAYGKAMVRAFGAGVWTGSPNMKTIIPCSHDSNVTMQPSGKSLSVLFATRLPCWHKISLLANAKARTKKLFCLVRAKSPLESF